MDITAVLLSWRRQFHIPVIVENLRRQGLASIICWCNEHAPTPEMEDLGIEIIRSVDNQCVMGRFLAASVAKTQAVLFTDDDLLVNNVAELWAEYQKHGGTRIIANLASDRSSRHWEAWQQRPRQFVELGFGSIMPRHFAECLAGWPFDKELAVRKADKIVTCLNPWTAIRADEESITRLMWQNKESGRDANALWLRRDHQAKTDEAVRLALHWREEKARGVA